MSQIRKSQTYKLLFGWLIQAPAVRTILANNRPVAPTDLDKKGREDFFKKWEEEIREDARTMLVNSTFRENDYHSFKERLLALGTLNGRWCRGVPDGFEIGLPKGRVGDRDSYGRLCEGAP